MRQVFFIAVAAAALVAGATASSAQTSPSGEYVNPQTGERVTFYPNENVVHWSDLGDGRYTRCIQGGADFCVSGETYDCNYQVTFVESYSAFTLRLVGSRAARLCPAGYFARVVK